MNDNLKGAGYMVLAGICFALANAVTWTVTYKMGFKAQSDAFWQYAIATAFSAPFIWRSGLASMKTNHLVLHVVRILLSVLGVQAFTQAFASGMAPWHVIALVMTSPFFVMFGAAVILGEKVGLNRDHRLCRCDDPAAPMGKWFYHFGTFAYLGGNHLGRRVADHQTPDAGRGADIHHHVAFGFADAG
jgi:hypothetical protein